MSFMDFSSLSGMGRLPGIEDPCSEWGDPRAAKSISKENEIKDRFEWAEKAIDGALDELDDLYSRASAIGGREADLVQGQIVDHQERVERIKARYEEQVDVLQEREQRAVRDHHSSAGRWVCHYEAGLHQEFQSVAAIVEGLGRQAQDGMRRIRLSVQRLEQAHAQAEAQRQAEAAAIAAREEAARRAEEERQLQEQRYREEQDRISQEREAQRSVQLEREIEAQRMEFEFRKAQMEAQEKREAEARAFEREQLDRQLAIEEARLQPQTVKVEEGPPPAWLQELLSAMVVKAGPPVAPMQTAPPVAAPEIFAYSPSGQPIDAFGQPIPTSYAPVGPAPVPPAVPGYYTPWVQTAAEAPPPPPPPALPGSPFQLTTFQPSGGELFGLGSAEGDDFRAQAVVFEAQAATEQDPSQRAALLQQADSMRRMAAKADAELDDEPEGPGVISQLTQAIKELVPVGKDVYRTVEYGPEPRRPQPTPMGWVAPLVIGGGLLWAVTRFLGKKK